MSHSDLVKAIEDSFNLNELRALCFSLDIDYENLAGDTKRTKIVSLIQHFQRRNNVKMLVQKLAEARPLVDEFREEIVSKENIKSEIIGEEKPTYEVKTWLLVVEGILLASPFAAAALTRNPNIFDFAGIIIFNTVISCVLVGNIVKRFTKNPYMTLGVPLFVGIIVAVLTFNLV